MGILHQLKRSLRRWSAQQESSVRQMSKRKTVGQRIAAYSKSKRADAKFLLLASAPMVTVVIARKSLALEGAIFEIGVVFSLIWFLVIVAVGISGYVRSIKNYFEKRDK
ncbi:MAG: hypothetical protein ABGW84_06835 [Sphingomonadaceae bacterium]